MKFEGVKKAFNLYDLFNFVASIISVLLVILLGILVFIKYASKNIELFENLFASNDTGYIMPEVLPELITESEQDYIIEKSEKRFVDSTVVSGKTGNEVIKKARDSKTAWLSKNDPVIRNIILRVCEKTGKDINNCEDLQIVKYGPSGYYNEHHDSCCDDTEACENFRKDLGNRLRTCVIYLSDDFEGGATKFPKLNLEIKPPKRSGILFHPMDVTEKKCHPKALHAGTPVLSGTKIIANVWIREKQFDSRTPL
jgi:prolyl 4-hydroxylase